MFLILVLIGLLISYFCFLNIRSEEFAKKIILAKWNVEGRIAIKSLGIEKATKFMKIKYIFGLFFGIGLTLFSISNFQTLPF